MFSRVPMAFATPSIPGFERFHIADESDAAAGGRLLLTELNCTSCHTADESLRAALQSKEAPKLDAVAKRVRPGYLRKFLADPHTVKPGTTMPAMFSGLAPQEVERRVEALVQFLMADGLVAEEMTDLQRAKKGEDLFHRVGCTACHNSRQADAEQLPTSVPLVGLEKKYSIPSLAAFISDPLKVRPSGRMPQLALSGDDARNVAHYLAGGADATMWKNARYQYYEGNWTKLPDFASLKPAKQGECTAMDLGVSPRNDQFGIVYEAFFLAPETGNYQFWLSSDDGSRLLIDGQMVIENDDIHPSTTKEGKIELTAGAHEVRIEYFEGGGETSLSGEFKGPKTPRQSLVAALSLTKEPTERPDPSGDGPFRPLPELVEEGRKLFVKSGCAQCHAHSGVKDLAGDTSLKVKPLAAIANALAAGKGSDGCLGDESRPGVPDFQLTSRQIQTLNAAISQVAASDFQLAASDRVQQTFETLNCLACHERDGRGGVEMARSEFFTGTQKDMGDEGRLPPRLTGVGAKLTHAWLEKIPADGADDRPYMLVAMPKFGKQNTGHLAALWEELDTLETVPPVAFEASPRSIKAAGRLLVGDKAFGCIKCHQFAGHKATGVQSLEMTAMSQRLKRDWFQRYLLDPQAFRPGTRMPAAWPNGKSPLKKVLDGQAATQIESIWNYLGDGSKAALPEGLIAGAIELVAESEPVIYRNFIEGLSPRGIAVAYPEKVNLAFDAERFQLAMVWSGKFIDASKHWQGRGQGTQRPLGELPIRFQQTTPLAVLNKADDAWPATDAKEQGYQFHGYRLTAEGQPVFLYKFGELEIDDYPRPAAEEMGHGIRRTLKLKTSGTPPENLWYRAVLADRLEPQAARPEELSYWVDDDWRTRLQAAGEPVIVREKELRVPVRFVDGQAVIDQFIQW